jgi:tetratricopeptide (TPR) repeat protein
MRHRAVADLAATAALLLLLPLATPCAAQATDSIAALSGAGRLVEAAAAAQAAAERAPGNPGANLRAGGMLIRAAEYDRALPFLMRVTTLDSAELWQRGWANVQLGRARLALGDSTAARQDLARALSLQAGRNTEAEAAALLTKVGGHPAVSGWSYVRTPHLRVHFPPRSRVEDLRVHSRRLEQAYTRLSRFFGELPGTADVYVWNSTQEAEPVVFRTLGFARPEYLLVHMRYEQTLGHELAHLFSYHAGHTTRRTRFVDEGTSVAFNLSGANLMREARVAVRLHGADELTVERLWDDRSAVPEPILYPIAGAFIERLIHEGGRDAFMRLLERQTLDNARRIYGDRLDRIIADFERDLRRR